jgi:hypothetical protein
MKKVTAFILFSMCIILNSYAQNEKESFKPSGKIFMRVFSNFNTTITDGTSKSAFALERAYLGYEFNLSDNFSGKINFDIGNPNDKGDFEMTAFIKNAYLKYTLNKFSVSFGMIPTTQFELQERIWGYRYVEKSFQDAYKIGSSADLGISAAYSFTNWLSADVIAVNGEGFKKIQADNKFKTGLGITLTPVKGLTARGYFDVMGKDSTQSTLIGFLGYEFAKGSIGAEYNLQNNFGYGKGKDLSGASVYASLSPLKNIKLYGRYDYLTSSLLPGKTDNWNLAKDGNLIIAGIEFQPVKGVKLSPNYRLWSPSDEQKPSVHSFFISCDIKF